MKKWKIKTFEDWQEICPWADSEREWVEEHGQYVRTGNIYCNVLLRPDFPHLKRDCDEWDCAIWKFKEFLEEKGD